MTMMTIPRQVMRIPPRDDDPLSTSEAMVFPSESVTSW